MRYPTILLVALLLVPPVCPALGSDVERGDEQLAEVISVPKSANGKLVAPGRSVKLKAKVTDRAGRPLSGRSVLFVAPETGPTGTFQGASPAGATFIRRTTNAAGVASAKLVTNATPGVFLVDAVVEPAEGAASGASTSTLVFPSSLLSSSSRVETCLIV